MFIKCFAEKSKDVSGDEGARVIGQKNLLKDIHLTRLRERERTGPSGNRGIYLLYVCLHKRVFSSFVIMYL